MITHPINHALTLNVREIELIIHALTCDRQGTWGDGRQEQIEAVIRKIRRQQKGKVSA